MRIAFLFNHDQIHQVAHSLPIAIAMAQGGGDNDIVVATTNSRLTSEVRRLLDRASVSLPVVELHVSSVSGRLFAGTFEPLFPAAKLAVYRDHLPFFRSLDALIVAEKTSSILKTRYKLHDLKIIHTRHGAGDRAIGFNKASARFDHVLVAGEKIRQRLIGQAGIPAERLSVVGYPKFDLVEGDRPVPGMFGNGKPTVLYNPHVSPHLSSWYRHGRAVLDYFRRNDRYNLIFAPHVMLFHRSTVVTIDPPRLHRPGKIDHIFYDAPNIHIDLNSSALSDMTYTRIADIYLGDASSQVYEFLYTPRPCIFLDSHHSDHRGNPDYAHWRAGTVIENPDELETALFKANAYPDAFRDEQRRMFAASFDLTDEPSSSRAARAISAVLNTQHVLPTMDSVRLCDSRSTVDWGVGSQTAVSWPRMASNESEASHFDVGRPA
jgi:hypothetical protein